MHTGKAITQAPVLKLGDYTLVEGKDYDVTYANNVEIDTATVTFEGKGNFVGELSETFQIKSAATPGQHEDNTPEQPADGKLADVKATPAKSTPAKRKLSPTGDTVTPWVAFAVAGAASITTAVLVRRRRVSSPRRPERLSRR